jgi:4'-phosphopantetheinyl transferase
MKPGKETEVKIASPSFATFVRHLSPKTPTLGNNDVHVWLATLDQPPSEIDNYLKLLSADERARADRFYFEKDREHFIVARGVLRSILGCYLDRSPEGLSFYYSSHGKPALTSESGREAISFNLSHSHGMALYAVGLARKIGIDLELIRDGPPGEKIAEHFFSTQEILTLRAFPATVQKHAFFLCWTRKEAYIKARGEGLSLPLGQFDVSLTPGAPAELLGARPDPLEAARWSLHDLTTELPGYAAALAVEGAGWTLGLWRWPRFQ